MTWNHPEWGDGVVPDDEGVESDELPSMDGEEMHPLDEDDDERGPCIGADCCCPHIGHTREECFTAEMARAQMPLGAIDVTYRRRRNVDADTHETLAIFVAGALAGRLTVRTEAHGAADERALLDVLVDALEANGATESR